jgi:hypothetical protein
MRKLGEGIEQLKARVVVKRLKARGVAKQLKARGVTRRRKGPEAMLLWAPDTILCLIPRNLSLWVIELTT